VGGSFLVRRASAFRGDRALGLRIHRRKSTRCLSDGPDIAQFPATVSSSFAGSFAYSADSAPLVQSSALVVSLVCHYPSPAAIFELKVPAPRSHRVRDRQGWSEAGISRVF